MTTSPAGPALPQAGHYATACARTGPSFLTPLAAALLREAGSPSERGGSIRTRDFDENAPAARVMCMSSLIAQPI